jgi:hypothetical protein
MVEMAIFFFIASTTALVMETGSISKTLLYFYQTTRRNKPQGSHLYTRRRENLKFHLYGVLQIISFLMGRKLE